MNTGETLRAAAARVRRGWCQHSMYFANRVCALGAIEAVCHDYELGHSAAETVERVLRLTRPTDGTYLRPIAAWNDGNSQTAENVAVGLELSALIWDQEQAIEQASSVGAVARAGEQVTG